MDKDVFFYGLFMDVALLRQQGVEPREARSGRLDGYRLVIGERATLVADPQAVAEGLLMRVDADQLERLYSEQSVREYVAEPVNVTVAPGKIVEAVCYNLPERADYGTRNEAYARRLAEVGRRVGLSDDYVDSFADKGS